MNIIRPTHCIIHCSATKDSKTVSAVAIWRWHLGLYPDSPYKDNPMETVGYTGLCELVDDRYVMIRGRSPFWEGGHTRAQGMNRKAVGYCIIGNFMVHAPPEDQLVCAAHHIGADLHMLGIPLGKVLRHSDVDSRKPYCPGPEFPWFHFLDMLSTVMATLPT